MRVCFHITPFDFYPSTSSTPRVRADSSSYIDTRYKLCGHKTTTQSTKSSWGVCGEFSWVRFLVPGMWEKVAQMPLLTYIILHFLGLGWPWVGELTVS